VPFPGKGSLAAARLKISPAQARCNVHIARLNRHRPNSEFDNLHIRFQGSIGHGRERLLPTTEIMLGTGPITSEKRCYRKLLGNVL
jgi:hypothetical protein